MDRAYTADTIRAAEAGPLERGEPLMSHAARALATTAMTELRARGFRVTGSEVLALVGGGNNGGDVLFAAADLARRGAACTLVLASDHVHAEGLAAALAAGCRVGELDDASLGAGLWLDGLTGIGLTPPVRADLGAMIETLRQAKESAPDEPIVIAADLPSGMAADSGRVDGPVLSATITCSFGGLKPAHLLPLARYLAGRVDQIDLGLALGPADVSELSGSDVADMFAPPGPTDHKYTRGVVTIHAGSDLYPGAGLLACAAAVHAGAGMVRAVTSPETRSALLGLYPEVVYGAGRCEALVAGPGLVEVDRDLVEDCMGLMPVVLDAGALSLARRGMSSTVVLTPHAGELSALLSRLGVEATRAEIEADPMTWARRTRDLTGATVVLKGGTDVIAGTQCYAQRSPSAWGATAGAGDVYAGVLGALLARGEDVAATAAAASWVCGQARGTNGPRRALDQARHVSEVIGG